MIFRQIPTDPDHDQDAEDDLFYRDTLQELVLIGATLARLLQTQATADAQAAVQGRAPVAPPGDHATAFDRISRAVRRSITLARSLREPAAPVCIPAHPNAAPRTPTLREAGEDAAGHPAAPGHDGSADTPSAGLSDRPEAPDRDAPDRDEDDTGRPPAEVIAEIRRDLGLDTPPGAGARTHGTPTDRTPADLTLRAQAAAPITAAPSSPRHPAPGPQEPAAGAAQPPSSPAEARAGQPAPVHPGCTLPEDPAEPIAMVPRHPGHTEGRWQPTPTG